MSFDSIRFTLQGRSKNIYLSLKNQLLYRKKFDFLVSRVLNPSKDQIVERRMLKCVL